MKGMHYGFKSKRYIGSNKVSAGQRAEDQPRLSGRPDLHRRASGDPFRHDDAAGGGRDPGPEGDGQICHCGLDQGQPADLDPGGPGHLISDRFDGGLHSEKPLSALSDL